MSEVRELPVTEPASTPDNHAEPAAGAAAMPLADCSAAEQAERHYLSIINPLLSEAYRQGSMETFADVLTWTLARVIAKLDKAYVTGDILRRIGNYTCQIANTNRAVAPGPLSRELIPRHVVPFAPRPAQLLRGRHSQDRDRRRAGKGSLAQDAG
jgi:hypothetical protein